MGIEKINAEKIRAEPDSEPPICIGYGVPTSIRLPSRS